MSSIFQSLLLIIGGSTQPELARQIKYLKVENEILRSKLPARITAIARAFFVLFVIDIALRRVKIAGVTTSPSGSWMKQVSRQLTDHVDGFLLGKTLLKEAGVEPLLHTTAETEPHAYAERFVRSIKEECLDRMIFFGEPMLRETILSYVEHYHTERDHQGLDNKLIDPVGDIGKSDGEVVCRERLGSMLKFYYRSAA